VREAALSHGYAGLAKLSVIKETDVTIDVVGDLTGILYVASGGATRGTAVLGDPSDQHVAGLGFEPRTFRL
jgi:hypothetical protein